MRKVKFKKAGAENFCCYIEPVEIEFKGGQLVLISGPNGVGKSTLFDIIPFTFYGVTTKNSRADDVVNTTVGKNCKTWVEFDVDNIEFLAERYHKFTKVGSTVILKEKRNGKFVDIGKGHREVKPIIELLLTPEKLFMNTLLFGQKVKNFFTDLTDSQQKEIFRKILTLDDYVTYSKVSTEILSEVEKDISSIEGDIKTQEILIEETKSLIAHFELEKRKFYDQKQVELEFQNTRYRKRQEDINGLVVSIKEYVDLDLESEMSKNSEQINQTYSKLSSIASDIEANINEVKSKAALKLSEMNTAADNTKRKVHEDLADAIYKVDKLLHEEDKELLLSINEVKNQQSQMRLKSVTNGDRIHVMLEQTKEFSNAILDGKVSVCPTCKQEIDEPTVAALNEHLDEINVKIEQLRQENAEIDKEVHKLIGEAEKQYSELAQVKAKASREAKSHRDAHAEIIEGIDKKLDELTEQINELTVQAIDDIREESEKKRKFLDLELENLRNKAAGLQAKLDHRITLEKDLAGLESELKSIEEMIKSIEEKEHDEIHLREAIQKEEVLIGAVETLKKDLEIEKKEIKVLEFWKGAFSSAGIPSMLIDESIPFMNRRISYYLERIAGGRYIVSFDTLKATKAGEMRDKISVNVLDTKTKANSRVQFSGGQTRLVDIATILTLGDLQNLIHDMQFNIILFDEIFDALDDENISYVSKLLRSLINEDKSIFIISHRHIDQIDADENLRFL